MHRKGTTFEWTEQCESAFQLLKAELTKMPALQYPNPNKPFKLFTDASKHSPEFSTKRRRDKQIQMNQS